MSDPQNDFTPQQMRMEAAHLVATTTCVDAADMLDFAAVEIPRLVSENAVLRAERDVAQAQGVDALERAEAAEARLRAVEAKYQELAQAITPLTFTHEMLVEVSKRRRDKEPVYGLEEAGKDAAPSALQWSVPARTCPRCAAPASEILPPLGGADDSFECKRCGYSFFLIWSPATQAQQPSAPSAPQEHKSDWQQDCEKWRSRLLTGARSHWCNDWDGLPVDETCDEWPCGCVIFTAQEKQTASALITALTQEIAEWRQIPEDTLAYQHCADRLEQILEEENTLKGREG